MNKPGTDKKKRVVLTGFMGVGKSSVARHLADLLKCQRMDLDFFIEKKEGRKIADIIDSEGEAAYRLIETANLAQLLDQSNAQVISLGGGTWTIEENRFMIHKKGLTSIWLESTFEHCWYNIKFSRKDRPLARNKEKAMKLFEERKKFYCLADWHFIIKPEFSSMDIARQIFDEFFS